jgi:hypothetical protein
MYMFRGTGRSQTFIINCVSAGEGVDGDNWSLSIGDETYRDILCLFSSGFQRYSRGKMTVVYTGGSARRRDYSAQGYAGKTE